MFKYGDDIVLVLGESLGFFAGTRAEAFGGHLTPIMMDCPRMVRIPINLWLWAANRRIIEFESQFHR
jgi:hypothetical protein